MYNLPFYNSDILQFYNSTILQFKYSTILQFKYSNILQFYNSTILQFTILLNFKKDICFTLTFFYLNIKCNFYPFLIGNLKLKERSHKRKFFNHYIFATWAENLEWWISGLMLNPNFFLISRLNMACSQHEYNLQKSQQIGIKDITYVIWTCIIHSLKCLRHCVSKQ